MRFRNRTEAGELLAHRVAHLAHRPEVLVLGLPRGGIPVAWEVARSLNAPLDVFVVRKLGAPGQEELAMGAISSGNVRVLNRDVIASLGISSAAIEMATAREQHELERRERAYRGDRPRPDMRRRTVILVDDGIATGATMRAAVAALRQLEAGSIVAATPTAALATVREMAPEVDEMVAVMAPADFSGVGEWYEDFSQLTDEDVREVLERTTGSGQAS